MARDDKLAEGWIEMEYTGPGAAPVSFTSNDTGTRYRAANGDRLPVHPKDVAWLEQRGWKKVKKAESKAIDPKAKGGPVPPSNQGLPPGQPESPELFIPTSDGQVLTSEETRAAALDTLFDDEEAGDSDEGDDEADDASEPAKPKTRRRKAADKSDDKA